MQITPPETVQDFQDLVQWLADEFHDGTVSAIAGRLGVSVATPAFWRRGLVLPNLDNIERMCQAYRLDFTLVRELVFKSQQARRRRPVPFTSGAAEAAPLPVGSDAPLVAEAPPHPQVLAKSAPCRDIMYSSPRRIHSLWGSTKEQVHLLCPAIRLSATQDRLRDLAA